MSTFWRIALAWMLALALPLQGHAAQRLMGEAAAPWPAEVLPMSAVHEALNGALNGVSHEVSHVASAGKEPAAHEAEAATGVSPCAGHDEAASAAGSPGSCSACASCCHALALPPTVPQLPRVRTALPELPWVRLALAHAWQEAPERPPRPSRH